jgi:hypothetical protein
LGVLSLVSCLALAPSPARAQSPPATPSAGGSATQQPATPAGGEQDLWRWAKPWEWNPYKDLKPFRDLPYYEPLRAEPRAARILLLIPAWSDEFPHSEKPGTRFAWQIVLGRELPIIAASSQRLDGPTDTNNWGLGLWIPVSFHVIEDFKDESAPIVDTDYRFGFMLKFQYGVTDNVHLGVRFVPWAHESTHLGDEYTIVAVRRFGDAFERVNVSYEYREYGISLEGEGLFRENDNWIVRHGGITPWGTDGYYSNHLLGTAEPVLTPSLKNYEPSLGFEYRLPEWRGRQTYASLDLRHKLVYNYHQTPDNPERQQWSWTLQVGRTVPDNTSGAPLKQYFFQLYRGVNPYGQLRSQSDYWSAGFGWVFGR